jgi:hypothetical protein
MVSVRVMSEGGRMVARIDPGRGAVDEARHLSTSAKLALEVAAVLIAALHETGAFSNLLIEVGP